MKEKIANKLYQLLDGSIGLKEIESWIEKPKHADLGDFAFPCFQLAKELKKSPVKIASELSERFTLAEVQKVQPVGAYLNFHLNIPILSKQVLGEVLDKGDRYGKPCIGNGEKIAIDLSSPNIAKPFSMGHLRSTVIGNALANIVEKAGYTPVRINHIGDWGTQFGKLITAYKKWGDEEKVKASPIVELHKLYVYFHEQAEMNPDLNEEARQWFKKLEDGDHDAVELWKWFRSVSLEAFSLVYNEMSISFDSFHGEAFYNDKMDAIIQKLEDAGLLEESDGAKVVRLDQEELPPCLIQKRDGATLYATRDLAAAFYRKEEYAFAKSLYVVGNEQSLHFKQLKAVLTKLNVSWSDDLVHIPFGMMLKDGKKMSTRKGKVVLLEEVLAHSVKMAADAIQEKNPQLQQKDRVAKQVGVGAVMFHDLKVFRQNDVHFDLEDMLKFEGETGPYVQYAHARACTLLKKAGVTFSDEVVKQSEFSAFDSAERQLVLKISEFEKVIAEAMNAWDPSKIAKFAIDLAQYFNHFYAHTNILQEEDNQVKIERLLLIKSTAVVLKESLRLLGVAAPEEM